MLLNTILKNVKNLISSMEVKMPYHAKSYETLESSKAADIYYSAYNKFDTYGSYSTLYPEALRYGLSKINEFFDPIEVNKYSENPRELEERLKRSGISDNRITLCKDAIVEKQREIIVNNYEEKNNYYRKLIGLPPIETNPKDYIRLTNKEYENSGTQIDDLGDEYIIRKTSLYNLDAYRVEEHIAGNGLTTTFMLPLYVSNVDTIFIAGVELDSTNYIFDGNTHTIEFIDYVPQVGAETTLICMVTDDVISKEYENVATTWAKAILSKFTVKSDGRLKKERVKVNNSEYEIFKIATTDTNYIRLTDFRYSNGIIYFDKVIGSSYGIRVDNSETNIDNENNHSAYPIRYIHNEKNMNKLYRLETTGVIDTFKSIYPEIRYLNYISATSKIDLIVARQALPFSIIRINKQLVPEGFLNKFTTIYNQCREYFSIVIYNQDLASEYKLYDNFIGLSIMVMTIQRILADSFKSGIQRDFYDWDFIQKIYKLYSIPFTETLPMEYHVVILKNLNNLLRYKSTDKVLYDLIDILGYDQLKVYRYFLVREQNLDENERPRFIYKTTTRINENNEEYTDFVYDEYGKPVIDYDKTFNVYFQAVDIREPNVLLSLNDIANRYDYSDVTEEDPYWIEDADSISVKNGIGIDPTWMKGKELLHVDRSRDQNKQTYDAAYNFVETKYIGLTAMYDMSEVFFEFMYAYSMMLNKKDEINQLPNSYVTLPKLDETNSEFSIIDMIIFIMSLMLKLRNVDVDLTPIPTTPSQVSGAYRFNFTEDTLRAVSEVILNKSNSENNSELYRYQVNSSIDAKNLIQDIPENTGVGDVISGSYGFNFDPEIIKLAHAVLENDPNVDKEVKEYFKDGLKIKSVEDVNKLFDALKTYKDFIIDKMNKATSVSEYNLYKSLYRISLVSSIQSDMYIDEETGEYYTYGRYLEKHQPILYNIIKNIEQDSIAIALDHAFSQIEKVLGNEMFDYNYVITGDMSPVLKALVTLINFFKSYTVDLASYNTIFVLDSKVDNRLRLYDSIDHCIKATDYNDSINGLYSDEINIKTVIHADPENIYPKLYKGSRLNLTDEYFIEKS